MSLGVSASAAMHARVCLRGRVDMYVHPFVHACMHLSVTIYRPQACSCIYLCVFLLI
jgi:hypothetical protein